MNRGSENLAVRTLDMAVLVVYEEACQVCSEVANDNNTLTIAVYTHGFSRVPFGTQDMLGAQ